MKRYFLSASVASVLFLTACFDDSTTNASTPQTSTNPGNTQVVNDSTKKNNDATTDTEGYHFNASLSIDKTSQTIVMSYINSTEEIGNCVIENDKYVWKDYTNILTPDTAHYDFLGDTLVLTFYNNGEMMSYGEMYIGGQAGNPYGSWELIDCIYEHEGESTYCFNSYYKTTFNLSEDGLSGTTTYDLEKEFAETSDFAHSEFMASLFEALTGRTFIDNGLYIYYMDTSAVEEIIKKYDINIIEKNATGETFELGGKTYTLKINQDDREQAELGERYLGLTNTKLNLDVTDGITTCNYESVYKQDLRSVCSDDNAPYYNYIDTTQINGISYPVATNYIKENSREFEDCIHSIAVQPVDEPVDDYSILAKRAPKATKQARKKYSQKPRFVK